MLGRLLATLSITLVAAAGCAPPLTPEERKAVDANIQRNAIDPATKQIVATPSGLLTITQNKSRNVAMVVGRPGVTSVATMVEAVEGATGCSAKPLTNMQELTGLAINDPLTVDDYRSFGGQIPILTEC
jgi:tryptophan synthase alpha subunit